MTEDQTIGRVVGETKSSGFRFTVEEGKEPAVFEYVKLELSTFEKPKTVLAQVTSVQRKDPAMEGSTPLEAVETVSEQGIASTRTLASARVIGYLSDTGVTRPRYAAKPGTPVKHAEDSFLEKFTSVGEAGLQIGSLLTRDSVNAELSISGLNRHLAILAATGAGKSHTAGVLIEEMLEQNASIIALDPHGDYTRMSKEKQGEEFNCTDSVNVLKARSPGDDEMQITVKTGEIQPERLASIAGVQENADNQKRLLREAMDFAEQEHGDTYNISDIMDVLDMFESDEERNDSERENATKLYYKFRRLESFDVFGSSDHNLSELVAPKQFTVLDLSGIPFEAQDIISELILDRVYDAKIRNKLGEEGENYEYPVFTVVEEAHNFCPGDNSNSTGSKLSEIAREGRKFGMFLTLITQRPSRIDQDVLSQCNSMIVQRIINSEDQRSIEQASESMASSTVDELPGLNVGEAIITGPAVNIPVTAKIRERKTQHGGEDVDIPGLLERAGEEAEEDDTISYQVGEEESSL